MSQVTRHNPPTSSPRREVYTLGYGHHAQHFMARRIAAQSASFFLPHLRPGMGVLDCGCGPGSITLGLAEAVAPGQVVGIDVEQRQVEYARTLAGERGIANVRFEVASVYELPYPDASFDAAFAHALLAHLGDPLRALREIRRVLKPGAVAGIIDTPWETMRIEPASPLLKKVVALIPRAMEYNGASPHYAPRQRALLLEAGFAPAEGLAFAECYGTPEGTRAVGEFLVAHLRQSPFTDTAIGEGWLDREALNAAIAEVQAWSERPDAYIAALRCAAIGWVADARQ